MGQLSLVFRYSLECIMDCHATTRGSIPGGDGVKPSFAPIARDSKIGAPSLNDLVVDGTFKTTNQQKMLIVKSITKYKRPKREEC